MSPRTFAGHAIDFNRHLAALTAKQLPVLPAKYSFMNPFADGQALAISEDFYSKYYGDDSPRRIILGINPGRHGAGLTGVPFTDSKKLDELSLDPRGITSHEPSAVFVYRVIAAWGGPEAFYKAFYFNSPLPLGLLRVNERGNLVNANYYDNASLLRATRPLIEQSMERYMAMPIRRDVAWCLGQGDNFRRLQEFNAAKGYFDDIIPLPHPRYVVQYRNKYMDDHVAAMVRSLSDC